MRTKLLLGLTVGLVATAAPSMLLADSDKAPRTSAPLQSTSPDRPVRDGDPLPRIGDRLEVTVVVQQGEYWTGGKQFARVWLAFYRPGTLHEPDLDDALIAAGPSMVPAIARAIRHRDMRFRRYAIGALGFIGDKRAIPTLLTILRDESEESYLRSDCLHAIYQIDRSEAIRLAPRYKDEGKELGNCARDVLQDASWLKEPSEEHGGGESHE